jgi:NAD(P)-dependent dehydrogenase (short-subunit alcohol dehydrogenase family)
MMQLTGKVALLTGGKRIGAVVADALAREGVDVALGYARSRTEAERTVAEITGLGRRSVAIQADLSRPEACAALVASSVAALGRLDILINMASVYVPNPFDGLDERGWNACLDVDLRASFLCSTAAVPHMRQQGGGRIINFSDWVAKSGRPRYPGYLPYYVAKAGVVALTEALALELATDNILVNAVAPGPILPPPTLSEEELRAVEESTPLGRWGGEIEIAKVVLALLASDYITGETVRVDGGRHLR